MVCVQCIICSYLVKRGFGRASRDYLDDPSVERPGRSTPTGERFYSTSPFWKTRWEMDPMFSLGFGERPDYSKPACGGSIGASCASYTPKLDFVKRHAVYKDLSIKSRCESPIARVDDVTPGPGAYRVRSPLGRSRSASIRARHVDTRLFIESTQRPGPGAYSTRLPCGLNRPAYSMGGRPIDRAIST